MKFFVIFALCLAAASANPYPRSLDVDVIGGNGRITNGNTASDEQFPYQVGLSLKLSALSSAWCGGSLISTNWVLTAAHCTDGVKSVTVYLGTTKRGSAQVTRTVASKDIIIHSGWNSKTLNNDISLIKIASVAYSSKIQPVALPSISNKYSTYAGDSVIASGWGRTSDSSSGMATNLQWAQLKVVANTACSSVYGRSIVTDSKLCVSTPQAVSSCNGDSGGPLVLEKSKLQIGLTSFGSSAGCEKKYPVVYTRVTSYLDWIKSNTGVSY